MEKPKPSLVDALIAFVLATAMTAITLPLSDYLVRVISALWRSGFDIATIPNSWWSYDSGFGFSEVLMVWIVFLIPTAIPFATSIAIVRYFRLLQWYVFVGCGILTALLGCGLLVCFLTWWEIPKFEWQSLLMCVHIFLEVLPHCFAFGLVAGGTCWMYFRFRGILER